MPQIPLIQLDWGNVAIFDATQSSDRIVLTVQCEHVSAKGDMVAVFQAISDANSVTEFRSVCSERGLVPTGTHDGDLS